MNKEGDEDDDSNGNSDNDGDIEATIATPMTSKENSARAVP